MAKAAKSPKRSAKKPAKKSPKKSPKARKPMSAATKRSAAKKRSMTACIKRCEKEVAMQYSPTSSLRAKKSVRRSRAAANPWIVYLKERQGDKPEGMKQSDWLKKIRKDYQ